MSDSNGNGTVFLSAARTAMGAFGGSLKEYSAVDLGVVASEAAIERSGAEPGDFGHVVMGNVMQTSADAIYLARHVGLRAGLPIETPAVTVNRLCGSGFQAVIDGSQEIELGESDVCLVGGAESMSQAPHIVRGARWGLRLGPAPKFEDSLWEALTDPYCGFSMAQTAGESCGGVRDLALGGRRGGGAQPAAGGGGLGGRPLRGRGRADDGGEEGEGNVLRAG